MSVAVEELQKHLEKEVTLTVIEGGEQKKVVGTMKAATVAGVPWKEKGKAGVSLLTVDQIAAVEVAPEKPKSVTQKKLKPITEGQMRQHLADRHGIALSWCRNASEEEAVAFHNTLDHADLGHKHVADEEKSSENAAPSEDAERQEALQS